MLKPIAPLIFHQTRIGNVWIMIQPATFENFELQISTSRKQWKIRNDLQMSDDELTVDTLDSRYVDRWDS
ncbi:uncharacterized protein PHALS_08046 [Plasmopara halstedii]|uniref:Uncharacterized protein n=1 Tax=Plasmopara halstedii TaxID=4781 RepID=A0A0P1B850_PLAHL|nr:uncharacterized protein PHALS_08046 [Plasmopara halstedii]CEG50327.1 hypothetical protein PHALS_08046 [Plasmopara halstedii]|eukprot:XP_024586696.1 hypothetical protein PHALS_08046 [Plasmopara halstedii]